MASAINSEDTITVLDHTTQHASATQPPPLFSKPESMVEHGQNTKHQSDEDRLITRPNGPALSVPNTIPPRPATAPSSISPVRSATRPAPLAVSRQHSGTFSHHRKGAHSIDSIPRQTIMKALVSRPPPTSNLSISSTIQSLLAGNGSNINIVKPDSGSPLNPRSRRLSESFSDLQLDQNSTTMANKLAALRSPCFFHRRFDDVVDIEKVLTELEDDAYLSHSRLMQTATGVREVSKQLQRRSIKRAVRNVMIVTKARDNQLVHLTRELAEWLLSTPRNGSEVGVNVYIDAKLKNSKRFNAPSLIAKDSRYESMLRFWTRDLCWTMPEKFDLVLTLGGDGTVLYTSHLFQRIVPPILSFSLGSLGFLTNFEFRQFKESLTSIMGDEGMRVNLRMRFTCTVYRASAAEPGSNTRHDPIEAEQFEVLNEVVIDRGPSPYVSNLELYGDNELLTVVQADGCIFSTPTGSTAYSLSAGGSLVHPDIPAILLTPICPHTLSFRPMLLNDSMALRIAVPKSSRATAYAAFDGKGRVELRQGDYVTIAASQYPFPTVLSRPTEWFDSISRTLRWNTRGAMQKAWEANEETGDGYEALDGVTGKKEEDAFDIDFEEEGERDRDSGYSAEGSSAGVGGGSPSRKFSIF
ncbi:putative mannosyl-oligosaccharide alpha-1,2-mannosidase [Venturia inaequalis]|nr:putative mannosyl-oligosaccharide alpha-1,2-mannosidase [Venturia inaequalis]